MPCLASNSIEIHKNKSTINELNFYAMYLSSLLNYNNNILYYIEKTNKSPIPSPQRAQTAEYLHSSKNHNLRRILI